MNGRRTLLVLFALALLVTPALAHVPQFAGENTSPERATVVSDATKSWSFYDSLESGQVRYYRLSLSAGERLRVSTFTPEDSDFTPSIALLSTTVNTSERVPGVPVPPGLNATVVQGTRPDSAGYEPFAPSANYQTAAMERTVPQDGSYLVAIYEPANRSGQVGVAIGSRETFSIVEYLRVPFDLLQVRQWEGQHPLVVWGPLAAATLLGGVALRRRVEGEPTPAPRDAPPTVLARPARYAVGIGAVLVGASALNTAVQIGLTGLTTGPRSGMVLTAMFVLLPAVCSVWAFRTATSGSPLPPALVRLGLVAAAALSLVTWAGFLLGPALLAGVALVPAAIVDTT